MRIDEGPLASWPGSGGMKRVKIIHEICRATLANDSIMKNDGEYRRCTQHGQVKLVPFYVMKETQITKENEIKLYWGCYLCFQEKYGTIKETEQECCSLCSQGNNLIDCSLCGDSVCMKHSVENICIACINQGRDA